MRYFVVDAFADALFSGNPAGVCLLDSPIDESLMQAIAAENNLAETAFLVAADGGYDLRWFTPTAEVDLCGHATLASAFVLHNFIDPRDQLQFFTKSGVLSVTCDDDLFTMNFPSRRPTAIGVIPDFAAAIGVDVKEAHLSRDLLLLVEDEATVRRVRPDFGVMLKLADGMGVIVTAPGREVDFVSRFFAPKVGVLEDPVTGSSHSTLVPFWSSRLGKNQLVARQLSARGGTLYCRDRGSRVDIAGQAVLYLRGKIQLD